MSDGLFKIGEIDREPHIGAIMEELKITPAAGVRVLVIDPCHGRLPKWFAVRQCQVDVVCLTEARADKVRADVGSGINVFRMPPSAFITGCTPQTYDVIICTDWQIHGDKLELLAQSRKALRWHGKLVLTCPATEEANRLARAMVWHSEWQYDLGTSIAHRSFAWVKRPGWLLSSFPRCGTHMLITALDRHPALSCLGEVFNPTHPAGTHGLTTTQQILEACWASPTYGFAMHCYLGRKGGAPGFQAPHKSFPHVWAHLPRDIPVISCRRRNLLAKHVSHAKANQTKVWFNFGQAGPVRQSVRIDPAKFLKDMEFTKNCWQASEEVWPHQHIVYYEDLAHATEATLRGVQEYLGVEPVALTPRTVKLGRTLREDVENFGPLRQALAGKIPDEWFKE